MCNSALEFLHKVLFVHKYSCYPVDRFLYSEAATLSICMEERKPSEQCHWA